MSAAGASPQPATRLGAPGMGERVLKGVAAMALIAVVNYVGQLVLVPIGMHAWGPVRYGEWVSLSALVVFLALSDFGLQQHVVNRMCAHHVRGEHEEFLASMHSALRLQGPVALGIWVLVAVVMAFLPLDRWLGVTTATRLETYMAVTFLAAELLMGVPMGYVRGTHRATGRLARAGIFLAVRRTLDLAVPALLMYFGASFAMVALGRVAASIAHDIVLVRDFHRQYPWFRVFPLRGDWREGLRMLAPGLLFFLIGIGDYLVNQGPLIVLQSVSGGGEVAHFSTHRTIANVGRMISGQIMVVVWPELTALSALSDASRLVHAHRTASKMVGFLVGVALFGFMPLAGPVYAAWTVHELAFDPFVLGMLVAQTTLWGFWSVSMTALAATNRQGRAVVIMAVNAAVGIGLSLLLIPRFGIRGAAAAALIADLAVASWAMPRVACKEFGDHLLGHAREVLPVIGLGLVAPAGLAGLLYWAMPPGLLRAVVVPPVFGLLSAGFFWYAISAEERDVARSIGRKIRNRIAGVREARS